MAREVLLIGAGGEKMGVVPFFRALQMAREHGLDLVQVASQAVPPVCKILDYGRYKYEQSKKEKEARKGQHIVGIREIRLRTKIKEHDLEAKARLVERLLTHGNKVKVTVVFRGREVTHPELGWKLIKKLAESVKGPGGVDGPPTTEGGNQVLIFSPKREMKGVKTRDAQTENPQGG